MGQSFSDLFKPSYGTYINILMLGLDNSGKTTLLYLLKLGEIVPPITTHGFNIEEVQYKKSKFKISDIGGKYRRLWSMHYEGSDGLILVVDSTDKERFFELKEEFDTMLQSAALKNCPVFVYANKQDLLNGMSVAEIIDGLELNERQNLRWFVQDSSFTDSHGILEGLEWLHRQLKK